MGTNGGGLTATTASTFDAVTRTGLAAGLVFLSPALFAVADDPAAAALTAIIYGLAGILAALLFLVRTHSTAEYAFTEAAIAVSFVLVLMIGDPATRALVPALPQYLLVVYLLCATFAIAARITGTATALVVLTACTLAPLWAAPLVEYAGNPSPVRELVIGSSPLTALAIALDLDYLRSAWFYGHSALGSMRYDYPAWAAILCGLSALPAAVVLRGLLKACGRRFRPFFCYPGEANP